MQLPRFLCAGCGRTETGLSWSVPCVALIVNKLIVREGLDPRPFAGHSLRAGFLTAAAEHGASIFKMMDVSQHKSVDTLRGYVHRADGFKDHAGAGFL